MPEFLLPPPEADAFEPERLSQEELRNLPDGSRLSIIVEDTEAPYNLREVIFEKSHPNDPDAWKNESVRGVQGWFERKNDTREPVLINGEPRILAIVRGHSLEYVCQALVADSSEKDALKNIGAFDLPDMPEPFTPEFRNGRMSGLIAVNPHDYEFYWRTTFEVHQTGQVVSMQVETPCPSRQPM